MYELVSSENLSRQAKRLVELVYEGKQSLKDVLRISPELMDGVDEYVKWYGATMDAIAQESETPPAGHGTKRIADQLKTK